MAAGRWVGSGSHGTGGEKRVGSTACTAGTPRQLLCSSALHRGIWWGSCPMGRFAASHPSRSGPAWSAVACSLHSCERRKPALWLSHPIPPFQYICYGPSSLATSHHSSLLFQVFYNNKGYHSMPTYLNALNNAILRANLPKSKGNPAAYGEDLEAFKGRSTSGTALGCGPTRL